MRHTSVFVTIAFLAGLTVGFFARGAGLSVLLQRNTRAADLAAIEKLHQQDIEVSLSQDPNGLVDIWTEDAVRLNPGNPLQSASRPSRQKMRKPAPDTRVSKC